MDPRPKAISGLFVPSNLFNHCTSLHCIHRTADQARPPWHHHPDGLSLAVRHGSPRRTSSGSALDPTQAPTSQVSHTYTVPEVRYENGSQQRLKNPMDYPIGAPGRIHVNATITRSTSARSPEHTEARRAAVPRPPQSLGPLAEAEALRPGATERRRLGPATSGGAPETADVAGPHEQFRGLHLHKPCLLVGQDQALDGLWDPC